jgi:nucleotide-binding universal stress UspA family protein
MVKSILVALDGSQHADSALEYGLWLARRMRARLIGLHVLDIVSIEGSFLHDVSGSLGFEPYLDFSSKMREALQERGNVLLDAFRTKCEQAGVPCETSLPMGIVANEICDQARIADLVVVGRRGVNEQFSSGLLGSTTESVTRKSPKPVLVTPLAWKEITRPLLAYDGSQRASAALHAAAEVTSSLGLPLTVVHVAKESAS